MQFSIQPGDFTLLSKERQESFNLSGKARRDVRKAVQEICNYVRNILPGNDLGRIAHELHINTGLIVFLSNFATNKKNIKSIVKTHWFLRSISEDELGKFFKTIEDEFEDFSINDIGKLGEIWLYKKDMEEKREREEASRIQEEEKKEREELNNKRYSLLCEFFGIPDNMNSRKILQRNHIRHNLYAEEIVLFCKENNISDFGENGWNENTRPKFLYWYAEKKNLSTTPSPDDRASYAGVEYLALFL